jgi:hypothetical protein
MRFYNPQFQQPISTFVPDATPWDMILKAGAAKEEAWAKGEAMPGELDVLEAALQAAPGHDDYKKDTVKKHRDQLDAILGDRNINYSDPTIQRKLKNVITSFGKDEDVLRIKRNKDYFDKYILPQLADVKNQGALMFTPGYDPITHKYTGAQHREDFDLQAISDPSTQKAYDDEASKVKADAIENVKQYGVQTGVDKNGNPIIEKDLESQAVKKVLKEKVDRAMWDFTTAVSGQDNAYGKWENFWQSKKAGKQLSQEELQQAMYDQYHRLGHKYVYSESKNVEKQDPDSGKTNKGGRVQTDETTINPSLTFTVDAGNLVGNDGNSISGSTALDSEIKAQEQYHGIESENITKSLVNAGFNPNQIVETFDPETGYSKIAIKDANGNDVPLNEKDARILEQQNAKIIQVENRRDALENVKSTFMAMADLDPNKPIVTQLPTSETATYNYELKEALGKRLEFAAAIYKPKDDVISPSKKFNKYMAEVYPHMGGRDTRMGKLSIEEMQDIIQEINDKGDNKLKDILEYRGINTSPEEDALKHLTKKHPNSKLAKYEKELTNYLTSHTYSTAPQFDIGSIENKNIKEQLNGLISKAVTDVNREQWSYVDDTDKKLSQEDITLLNDAMLKVSDDKSANYVETGFYYDRKNNKYVPTIKFKDSKGIYRNVQFDGEISQFNDYANKASGYSEYNIDLNELGNSFIQHSGVKAELKLNDNESLLVKSALTSFSSTGKKINQGDMLVKVPGSDDAFTYVFNNDYELVNFKKYIADSKKANIPTDQAINDWIKLGGKLEIIKDPGVNYKYFKSGK